ncbi:MAG: phage tail protein, partial [Erysipelotrichaceae bacterium]|nr:phage tail protein [Erysipelotrichaceae bacterium]
MIKILDHTKPLADLVNDQSNGLGYIEQISGSIEEGLNGIYEGEVQVLVTDKHFANLFVGGYLLIELDEVRGKQIFEIYHIGKDINGVVTLKVQHITYKLSKAAVKPFTATGAVAAKNGMLENLVGSYPFTMTTDIVNETSKFTLDRPRSFRECLGGYEGSLLDVFRGEYEWDNLTVKMLAKRGSDNGVRIAYGKNLTDFQQEENNQNTYTAVLGYAVVNETTYTGDVYYKIQSALPKVKIVDFSSDYEGEDVPTTTDLTAKARSYAESNDIEVPSVNLTIAFIPLWQTEEYKNIAPLERVNLGDTVHVYFDKLNVEASARVIKTTWNINLKKYDKVELGNAKANMNTVINQIQETASQEISGSQGFLEAQLNEMATLIINGLGLHRTLVPVGEDGGFRIYLHNKKTLDESDTQYVFTAEGFLI